MEALQKEIVQRARIEAELRQAYDELAQRMQKRTTELASANAALQQQTTLLQSILECMREEVIVVNGEGKIILMNQAAQQTFGVRSLSASDTAARDWFNFPQIYSADRQTFFPADQLPLVRALRGESVNDCEQFIRRTENPEGSWRSVNGRPLFDGEGEVCGGVAVGRDITERKRLEEALQASESMYRSLIGQAADGIYILDSHGNFLLVNAHTCLISGYSEEELLRMNIRDFLFEEDLQRDPLRLEEIFTTKAIVQMERRARRRDGTPLYLESRARAR